MNICIIQARMGSSRLPGKVLKDLDGVPLLKFQVERVRQAPSVDLVVVATSMETSDDVIEEFCQQNKVVVFRGSESNVLSRYYDCALEYDAKVVIRLTADCPFSDPKLIEQMIHFFNKSRVDYVANTVPPQTSCWPDGSDVEVFSFEALKRAHQEATSAEDREHVTFVFWKKGRDLFRTAQFGNRADWSRYRFTIDYPEDYELIKSLYFELKSRGVGGHIHEIVAILDERPDLRKINEKYYFGIGWEN